MERHRRAPSVEFLVVLCDVAGLEVIGCACLAGGIPYPFNAAGALAEVDSLNDVAVAAFQALVWSGDGSGARWAFVPAAGAPLSRQAARCSPRGRPSRGRVRTRPRSIGSSPPDHNAGKWGIWNCLLAKGIFAV